ncbi:MAG TPA: amidohydrolase [Terriglobales bacterium]|nr:amidohydrolase [Terriglobales bacterium]
MKPSVLLLFLIAAMTPAHAQSAPDAIYLHGNIYVGAVQTFSPPYVQVKPRAQALAVRDGRIVAVGSDAEISRLKDKHTRVIDLAGHFVMPGFNDAHTHLASAGFGKMNVDLTGTRSLQEMQARIAQRAKTVEPGEWIRGRGWDHTLWPDRRLPDRQDLDAVTGDHPAFFGRVDGHIAVVNSAALRAAGITRNTPDPPGGKIDRDASGEPTGILREGAMELVTSHEPKPTPAQHLRAMQIALQDAAESGVTSAQDFSDWDDFLVAEELENQGHLTLRLSEWLPFVDSLDVLEKHRAYHSQSDPMLRTGMLKGFMDGSLGSRTAALLAPYSDDPKNSGLPQFDQAKLNAMIDERAAAGFQVGFHAIGDRGAEMALQAFAEAERYLQERQPQAVRTQDRRWRVEHAQVLDPGQFARFRELGVIASMQPNHLLTDMNWALARLGPQRARYSYAWKSFLQNRVWLAFGTDYPVEAINPFRGLYAAVTRKNEAGTAEYFPQEKLTLDQAIAAYTTGSAYAEFAEHDKGMLQPGMWADFVVLDRDITRLPPAQILHTRVLRTVVGGKAVFEAK